MGARCVEFGNTFGNCLADAGYLCQSIFGYERPEGLGEERNVLSRPQVGLCTVRIATVEHGPSAKLIEQTRYLTGISIRHDSCLREGTYQEQNARLWTLIPTRQVTSQI